MPSRADTHIQKIAPAPPRQRAAATPRMFPVPIAAARAVEKVWNWVREVPPLPDLVRRLPNVRRRMVFQPQNWKNRSRKLRHSPVPSSSTSSPVPQMYDATRSSIISLLTVYP